MGVDSSLDSPSPFSLIYGLPFFKKVTSFNSSELKRIGRDPINECQFKSLESIGKDRSHVNYLILSKMSCFIKEEGQSSMQQLVITKNEV
jgi:hypothetical protein